MALSCQKQHSNEQVYIIIHSSPVSIGKITKDKKRVSTLPHTVHSPPLVEKRSTVGIAGYYHCSCAEKYRHSINICVHAM